MVERPYKCALCHGTFRTESGMMGHVYRNHEAPQALEALGKTYEKKLDGLRKENATQSQEINNLKAKLDSTTKKLTHTGLLLIEEKSQNVTLTSHIRNMDNIQARLVIAIVVRDNMLMERLGIKLPSPFGESDNNTKTSI